MKKWLAILFLIFLTVPAYASNWVEGFDKGPLVASDVTVDCTAFTLNLSCANKTVQSALNTLDQLVAGGSSGYQTIQDETTPLTQRTKVNFTGTGVTCVDNAGSTRTDCTISGGGSASAAGGTNAAQYNSGSSTFAGDETKFSFNGSNVGIGTTDGKTTLDVVGSIRARGTNSEFFGDDTKSSIQVTAATSGDLTFKTNATEALRISNNNRVGIGTVSPQAILQVYSTSNPASILAHGTNSAGSPIFQLKNDNSDSGLLRVTGSGAGSTLTGANGGGMELAWTGASNPFYIGNSSGVDLIQVTNNTDRLHILGSGNIGVGSANPGQKLDVNGFIRSTSLTASQCVHTDATGTLTSTGSDCSAGGAGTNYWNLSANNVGINTMNNVGIGTNLTTTSSLTVMSGNVGIGTWIPGGQLQVNNPTNLNSPFMIDNTGNVGIGTNLSAAALTVMNGNVGIGTWAPSNKFIVLGGNIGIGTRNPGQALDVTGIIRGSSTINTTGGNVTTATTSMGGSAFTGVNITTISMGNNNAGAGTSTSFVGSAGVDSQLVIKSTTGVGTSDLISMVTGNNGNHRGLLINSAGNVGFGTTTPFAKIDVLGNIGIGTVGGDSYLLTSPPNGGAIVYGNVGIGTWLPTHTLALGNGVISSQWGSPIPVISSCGSAPSGTVKGTDQNFEITVGGTATTCTATFGGTYADALCGVTNQSMSVTNAMTYTVSATTVVISQAVGLSGDLLDVHCGFKN